MFMLFFLMYLCIIKIRGGVVQCSFLGEEYFNGLFARVRIKGHFPLKQPSFVCVQGSGLRWQRMNAGPALRQISLYHRQNVFCYMCYNISFKVVYKNQEG